MSGGALLRTALFAAGAAFGGAAATVILKRREAARPVLAPVPSATAPAQVPVLSTNAIGKPQMTEAGVLTAGPISPALRYGNPGPVTDMLVRQGYVSAYDRRLRHPSWAAEHLTAASLQSPPGEKGDRGKSTFVEDESIPAMFRARLKDYFRSGYDRGHMVPAADAKSSQTAMDETFFLTNIAPQVGDGFNRHYWAYLEEWCRKLTGTFKDVYVFTVPLYLPRMDTDGKWRVTHEVIGTPPNVAVPTHFAKVVLVSKPVSPSRPEVVEISTGAFVLPNAIIPDEAPLTSFITPVDAVERAAGLTLFSDEIKAASKHICKTAKCEVVVRRFDDAQKNARKAIAAPK